MCCFGGLPKAHRTGISHIYPGNRKHTHPSVLSWSRLNFARIVLSFSVFSPRILYTYIRILEERGSLERRLSLQDNVEKEDSKLLPNELISGKRDRRGCHWSIRICSREDILQPLGSVGINILFLLIC